jgi:glycosyltransferase involved in cell wall biosynthesis
MKLMIAIPCSWPSLPREFVMNLLAATSSSEMSRLSELGITEHAVVFNTSFPLDLSRNQLCRQALETGADYLLFLDADMVYPRDFIYDLIRADVDVISPLYFKKVPPYAAVCAYRRSDDRQLLVPLMKYERGLVEVDVTGCGGMLIRREVLEKVGSPWFAYDIYKPTGEMTVSEDVTFCEKVQQAGFKVMVDTRIVAGHIGSQVVGEGHWLSHRERVYEYAVVNIVDGIAALAAEDLSKKSSDFDDESGSGQAGGCVAPITYENRAESA